MWERHWQNRQPNLQFPNEKWKSLIQILYPWKKFGKSANEFHVPKCNMKNHPLNLHAPEWNKQFFNSKSMLPKLPSFPIPLLDFLCFCRHHGNSTLISRIVNSKGNSIHVSYVLETNINTLFDFLIRFYLRLLTGIFPVIL